MADNEESTTSAATWAGTHVFGAQAIHTPRTLAEAQQLISDSPRIRALGTRHSFNDIADSPGVLVSLVDLEPGIEIDETGIEPTVTVTGGTTYGVLAAELESRGFALHNMGSLPHISVAGAISTATHGSGNRNGNLATAVRALDVIGVDGEITTVRAGDPAFEGSVVALGLLGVTARVTLAIEPSFQVRQDIYSDLPWSAVLERFDEISGCGYSVSLFTNWLGDTVQRMWLKTRLADGDPGELPDELFGGRLEVIPQRSPAGEFLDNTTLQGGIPGPWSERLPHFRFDATPSNGDEIQTEYLISRADAAAALEALRPLGPLIEPALLITELRTVAADELWMSTAYQRDSLCIHFTWKNLPAEVAAIIPLIEAALERFSPRAHWGKVFTLDAATVRARYNNLDDFAALVASRDPENKFGNAYSATVLGS